MPPIQGLANTLWAFAKLEQPAPRFCRAAAAELGRRLGSFSLRDLSQILWAFAKLEHRQSAAVVSLIADHTAAVLTAEGGFLLPSPCLYGCSACPPPSCPVILRQRACGVPPRS